MMAIAPAPTTRSPHLFANNPDEHFVLFHKDCDDPNALPGAGQLLRALCGSMFIARGEVHMATQIEPTLCAACLKIQNSGKWRCSGCGR